MTIVEFFDLAPIENIISSLTMQVDKAVLVGASKAMRKRGELLRKFLADKGRDIEFEYVIINKYDLSGIVAALSRIVENEAEPVFDLNGGEDLLLVAMGIVYERYRDKKHIEMHRYNIKTGTVTDCDDDGKVFPEAHYKLTVDDNIRLNGGAIRYAADGVGGTFDWKIDEEFRADVLKLWEICKRAPNEWNKRIGIMHEAERRRFTDASQLNISIDKGYLVSKASGADKLKQLNAFLDELDSIGAVKDLVRTENEISYRYKDLRLRNCLRKEGTVLELTTLIASSELMDRSGERLYNDVMNGVVIDWDGVLHSHGQDTSDVENEIDVFLMKGLVPILISCKNGMTDTDELYKLQTVANRFGGGYAKKVLITTYLRKSERSLESLKQRAKEMKIRLIENVHSMSFEEFKNKLKNL